MALSKNPGLLPSNELKLDLCLSAKGDATQNAKFGKEKIRKKERGLGDESISRRVHSWMPAGVASVECVRRAPSILLPAQAVNLCKGAVTVMPAKCARLAPQSLAGDQLVKLCQSASCVTPAYCAHAVIYNKPSGTKSSVASSFSRTTRGKKRKAIITFSMQRIFPLLQVSSSLRHQTRRISPSSKIHSIAKRF